MAIHVRCACGLQFKVKTDFAGKRGKCPTCGHGIAVPPMLPPRSPIQPPSVPAQAWPALPVSPASPVRAFPLWLWLALVVGVASLAAMALTVSLSRSRASRTPFAQAAPVSASATSAPVIASEALPSVVPVVVEKKIPTNPVTTSNPIKPIAPVQPATPVVRPTAPPRVEERAPAANDTNKNDTDKVVDLIVSGFKTGNVSADTRAALAAMLKANVPAGRAALARANDNHGEALRLAAGLLDSPMIDPFSLIAYTFNYVESAAAFVPNGKPDPVSVVTTALTRRAEVSPELRPYFADAVKALCAIQLIHHLRADRPVGLSDDILFSGLRRRPSRRRDLRTSAEQKRAFIEQKRFGRPADPNALPPQASDALPHEELCNNPEDRKRYLGRPNAPRWWFLERNVGNDGYYLCTGLWYNAMTFADRCDPSSRERWEKVFNTVAHAYAEQGRYTSGVIVKLLSSNNAAAFLFECGRGIDAKDTKRVTSLVIALGYFLEATRGKWSAGLKGTALGELHTRLSQIAVPAELERARRCGDVDRAIFEKRP